MNHSIRLAMIPEDKYSDYRYDVIFRAYKWDPQVEDQNTVAKYAVLLNERTAAQLGKWAEELSKETILMEEALINRLDLIKELGLPISKNVLKKLAGYKRDRHIRLMRFDFHPVADGWAVSEVNSDVPGGLAEASILPEIAGKYFKGCVSSGQNVAQIMHEEFVSRIKKDGSIAFVHATSYADDRQVMQFISDYFSDRGINTVFAAPDQIEWIDKKAHSIVKGKECPLDGIIRFYPQEWFTGFKKNYKWSNYYDCETASCNHPIAIFAQSKRLPLIWDKLGVDIPVWKKFLPETKNPKDIKKLENGWLYKPALGRVGEDIIIKELTSEKKLKQFEKLIYKSPIDWILQKKFESEPLITESNEKYHLCIGVFTVNNKPAGFYARINQYALIDAKAKDIPVLIQKEGNDVNDAE